MDPTAFSVPIWPTCHDQVILLVGNNYFFPACPSVTNSEALFALRN